MSLINTEILPFTAKAYYNNDFVDVSDADLRGKWSIVFFYPADFTFVCPTELGDMADLYAEFKKLGVEIFSVSTDTHHVHKAWHDTSDTIGKIQYYMVGDPRSRHHAQLRQPARGRGPGRPRHLPRRPRRRSSSSSRSPPRASAATRPSCSARSRPRSTCATTRARSARPSGKRARRPSPRRSTSSARSDASSWWGSGHRARTPTQAAHPPSCPARPEPRRIRVAMLDAATTAQLKSYLEQDRRADRARRLPRRQPQVGRAARAAQRDRRPVGQDHRAPRRRRRAASVLRDQPRRHRHQRALRRHPDGPRVHLATCSPSCRSAATRRPHRPRPSSRSATSTATTTSRPTSR